ncbi:MAG: carbohydrate binding family 9 domain-containing protein [Planctomycetes bacterium]|nr:carbohydrate binding family 9 domain-containing protein [Planctomycetota bacterium]
MIQKRPRVAVYVCLIGLLGVFTGLEPCHASAKAGASAPSMRALKIDGPVTIDGVLDEPFWQEAEIATNCIDLRTALPAAQQTLIRVAYTKTDIYIAIVCFDDRIDQIHATELREDRLFRGDDWVEVLLDPMHGHRSKYAFFSNPLGTRVDATQGPNGEFSTSWSAEWEQAARIESDRWIVEMKIPLGILNYVQADDQVWGINFTRKRIFGDVSSFWSFDPTGSYEPRHFGHLTGLDLADSQFDRNLEVTPYVSVRRDENGQTETDVQTGGDVSFRLTPSVITSWTLNPDFGQVESDADTIELRDTERFLPEKRLFFREGSELLDMPNLLYYSRRFSDIDTGAKASGDWRGTQFSVLNVQGETVHGDTRTGNSSVVRVLQNVGDKSHLGYYANATEFGDGHSRVLGSDGHFYLSDDVHLLYQAAMADDRLRNEAGGLEKERKDYLGYLSLYYDKYPWEYGLRYRGITKGFDPILSFIPRRDIFGPSAYMIYRRRSAERWYKNSYAYAVSEYYQDSENQTTLRDYTFGTGVDLQNDLALSIGHAQDYHAPHHNQRTDLGMTVFKSDYWRSMELAWTTGTFETVGYHEFMVGKRLKPLERWPIRYEFTIRFEEEQPDEPDDPIWLNRVIFDYFFTDRMWLKSSLQHRSTDVHNISLIYGWEVFKDAHWYLVYNNVMEESDPESVQGFFTKVAYTFR